MKFEFSKEEIEDIHRKIGLAVKKYREYKGFTQLDLSLEMGNKSVSLVSAAELFRNKKRFNIGHLYKISKILNIPMVAFFEETSGS
ncbi:helix-turn-helix transcriptional regulator [Sulfurimonas sp.]|uniref:helix-turn-helix transcriptional regulator n=1 Tax=Sulfurimonas sp. TaxID=2022749 RepID=UPI0019D9F9D6|nr:helix-turn-helix transcriptional regulator [Sulfurimonas sp.]MBE0515454.1 helix-turn-helix transcriptional regulator [Sulfurimonas sp.]